MYHDDLPARTPIHIEEANPIRIYEEIDWYEIPFEDLD
jgi:hypothetical protein